MFIMKSNNRIVQSLIVKNLPNIPIGAQKTLFCHNKN